MRVTYLRELPKKETLRVNDLQSVLWDEGSGLKCEPSVTFKVATTYVEYFMAAQSEADIILIGETDKEGSRVSLIRELSDLREFDTSKENWLYGLSNPAELSVYFKLLSGYLYHHLPVALCESAYRYAYYGARFSRIKGVLGSIPDTESMPVELDSEQSRVFYYNKGIVDEFLSGLVPSKYVERTHAIIG